MHHLLPSKTVFDGFFAFTAPGFDPGLGGAGLPPATAAAIGAADRSEGFLWVISLWSTLRRPPVMPSPLLSWPKTASIPPAAAAGAAAPEPGGGGGGGAGAAGGAGGSGGALDNDEAPGAEKEAASPPFIDKRRGQKIHPIVASHFSLTFAFHVNPVV